MKLLFVCILIIYNLSVFAQHNFLGKSQEFIAEHYKLDPEYIVKIDTINKTKSLITCNTFEQYPYYTYEIDLQYNMCISYAFVSKNEKVLQAYIDILDHLGKIIEHDKDYNNFTYKIEKPYKTVYYAIKKPFINGKYYSRKKIFFIIITEEVREE